MPNQVRSLWLTHKHTHTPSGFTAAAAATDAAIQKKCIRNDCTDNFKQINESYYENC